MTINKSNDNALEQNCRPEWALWTCIAGNVCGLTSTTLWFLVLVPQVWKNFRRKSVAGLSFLWAVANFTASLTNLFFVFMYAEIPLYGRINAVYMPILEFTILTQFWIYATDQQRHVTRYVCAAVCCTLWTVIILVQLFAKIYPEMQWVAISLWCIETFPQVILNMKLRSTRGQSTRSVLIATVGKMTDFFADYGLIIPMQYVVMTYFSSSVAYVNSIQVAWYFNSDNSESEPELQGHSNTGFESEELPSHVSDTDHADSVTMKENVEYTPLCSSIYLRWRKKTFSDSVVRVIRWSAIAYLTMALTLFVVGIVWRTGTYISLLAPGGILLVLFTTYLYYHTKIFRKLKFSLQ